jgi:hypothetical protein
MSGGINFTVRIDVLLLPPAEALNNVASSIAASLESQVHHTGDDFETTEQTSVCETVYIMDGSQSEGPNSNIGMEADASILLAEDNTTDESSFIVQDLHGNQFKKIAGVDENGKRVIFFQLSDEGHVSMAPAALSNPRLSLSPDPDSEYQVATHFDFETNEHGQPSFSVQNDHMYLDPQKW